MIYRKFFVWAAFSLVFRRYRRGIWPGQERAGLAVRVAEKKKKSKFTKIYIDSYRKICYHVIVILKPIEQKQEAIL